MPRTPTGQKKVAQRRADYKAGILKPAIEKWCKMCDQVLPTEAFYIRFDADHLLSHYCRECHKKDCKIRKRIKRINEQTARRTEGL